MNYPYQNNTQFLQNLMLQQAQGQPQEVVKVSGKNGIDALQLPPNSSGLYLDITAPIVWLVQTDGAGYKTSMPYDISPHESEETTQYKTLEERITKLEETLNAKSNVKSTTKRTESE